MKDEDELPAGGILTDERPPWDPWAPIDVAQRLAGVDVQWCVAAGWAIDLFRGEVTRDHEDLEIAVPASRFNEIRSVFAEFDFDVVGSGHVWPLDSAAFDVMHQTWLRDRGTGVYHLDVFREPHDGDTWICRLDERIRRPYAEIIARTPDGIPYLAPEVALLFKASHAEEPKNVADLAGALPLLDGAQHAWLVHALSLVHPYHPWLIGL